MKKNMLISILAVCIMGILSACHKNTTEIDSLQYAEIMGSAEGIVNFISAKEPDIRIKDIRSYIGESIDYSTGIGVKNADQFDDFQMWVDATGVDIYTPGRYTAVYRFVCDGENFEKTIGVTIVEKEQEVGSQQNQEANNTDLGQTGTISDNHGTISDNGNSGTSIDVGNGSDTGNTSSSGNISNDGNTSNDGNVSSGSANQEQVSREIITSVQTATKKPSTIGYTNIELLSGKYVKIKCTSDRYIVSTRTDVGETIRDDKRYQVSKLIITFNTGEEQVLEVVEKTMN